MSALRPITSPPGSRRPSQGMGIVVSLGFLLIGLCVLGAVFVPWLLNVVRAAGWPETPCRILRSSVESTSGGKGPTYRVAVTFEYEAGGGLRQSDRYGFWEMSTSGRAAKRAIVDRLAPGTRTVCYVDPSDPARAVLNRGLSIEFLIGIVPLAFVMVGGAGIVRLLRLDAGRTTGRRRSQPVRGVRLGSGPTRGVGPLVAMAALAAFWNGAIVLIFGDLVRFFDSSRPTNWFAAVLAIPFVLIGLFLLASVARIFLGFFGPRTRLEVPRSPIPLGGMLPVGWRTAGKIVRGREFRIVLEGIEIAGGSGRSRQTREEIFATIPVADSEKGDDLRHGSRRVQVPARAMHSVDAGSSGIVWAVRLYRRSGRREAVVEQETVAVRPAPELSRGAR